MSLFVENSPDLCKAGKSAAPMKHTNIAETLTNNSENSTKMI